MVIPLEQVPGRFLYIVGCVNRGSGIPLSDWRPEIVIGNTDYSNQHDSTSREPICFGFYPHFFTKSSRSILNVFFGEDKPYDDNNHIKWELFDNPVIGENSNASANLYSININKIRIYYTLLEGPDVEIGDKIVQKTFDYLSLDEWQPETEYKQLDTIRDFYEVTDPNTGEVTQMPLIISNTTNNDNILSTGVDKPDFSPQSSPVPNQWHVIEPSGLDWLVRPYKFETAADVVVRNYVLGEIVDKGSGWADVVIFQMPEERKVEDERPRNDDGELIEGDELLYNLIDLDQGGLLEDFKIQDAAEQFTVKKLYVKDTIMVNPDPANPNSEEEEQINPDQFFLSINQIEYYGQMHLDNINGEFQPGENIIQNGLSCQLISIESSGESTCEKCSFKKACVTYDNYVFPGNIDYMDSATPPAYLHFDTPRKVNTIRMIIRYIKEN